MTRSSRLTWRTGWHSRLRHGLMQWKRCACSTVKDKGMLTSDFKEFAELLNSNGAEYLVVGGYALAAYGHPRYTGDLNFWIATNLGAVLRSALLGATKTP